MRGDQIVFETDDAAFGHTLELSRTVPVVVDLWASWCGPCKRSLAILERLVRARTGGSCSPRSMPTAARSSSQAFQAQSIPMVVALVARPAGAAVRGRAARRGDREVFDQLLQLAAQHGVTGRVE